VGVGPERPSLTVPLASAPALPALERFSPSAQAPLHWPRPSARKRTPKKSTPVSVAGLYQDPAGLARQVLTLFDDQATIQAELEAIVNRMTGTGLRLADVGRLRRGLPRKSVCAPEDALLRGPLRWRTLRTPASINSRQPSGWPAGGTRVRWRLVELRRRPVWIAKRVPPCGPSTCADSYPWTKFRRASEIALSPISPCAANRSLFRSYLRFPRRGDPGSLEATMDREAVGPCQQNHANGS